MSVPPLPAWASAAPVQRRRALLWLALACVAWGWSFPAMKWGTEAVSARTGSGVLAASATFIAWRFLLAALLYGAVTFRHQRGFTRADWLGGLTVGGTFVAGLYLQIIGLRYTLPSVSSFLTALYVVLLPLAQSWFLKRPPRLLLWLAVALALGGLAVLGTAGDGGPVTRPPFPACGEVLTLLGAVLFTAQILFLDRYAPEARTERLSLVMFAVTALGGWAVALALPEGRAALHGDAFARLGGDYTFSWALLSTTLFSSVLAFHLMNRHQPNLAPSVAGVVYCLEPVFATLWSVLLGGEEFRRSLFIGGGLILSGVLLAAWRPAGFPSGNTTPSE